MAAMSASIHRSKSLSSVKTSMNRNLNFMEGGVWCGGTKTNGIEVGRSCTYTHPKLVTACSRNLNSHTGAFDLFFVAVIDIFRRIIVILIVTFLFNEGFSLELAIAIVLVVLGFLCYMQAGRIDKAAQMQEKKDVLAEKLLEINRGQDDQGEGDANNRIMQSLVEDSSDIEAPPSGRMSMNVESPTTGSINAANASAARSYGYFGESKRKKPRSVAFGSVVSRVIIEHDEEERYNPERFERGVSFGSF